MADRAQGILLGTSVVIAHLRGRIDVLALSVPTEPLFLPLVALGELYKGAEKSKRSSHNRQLVDDSYKLRRYCIRTAPRQRPMPR
jgi:predicted nucleic acid-binding protein